MGTARTGAIEWTVNKMLIEEKQDHPVTSDKVQLLRWMMIRNAFETPALVFTESCGLVEYHRSHQRLQITNFVRWKILIDRYRVQSFHEFLQ